MAALSQKVLLPLLFLVGLYSLKEASRVVLRTQWTTELLRGGLWSTQAALKMRDRGNPPTIVKAERWVEDDGEGAAKDNVAAYAFYANMVNRFADHGIQLVLGFGSLLGARRHFGIIPWGDKDVDFVVFSTNVTAINAVLDHDLHLEWRFNTDGIGPPDTGGFGYHINTPFDW